MKNWLPLALLLTVCRPAGAETVLGAAQFSLMKTGAREAALGGAICALDADPTALLTNPAGLARMNQALSVSADTALLPHSQGLSFIGLAGWVQPEMAAGAGVLTYGAGDDIEFRAGNTASPDSTVSAQSQAFVFGAGTHLFPTVWLGMGFKMIYETIGDNQGSGYSSDLGISFQPFQPLVLSAVFRNFLWPTIDWKNPPTQHIDPSIRLGAGWEAGNWRVTTDGSSLTGPYPQWGAGVEWDAHSRLTLRAGMEKTRPSAGFGSRLRYPGKVDARLDYAFVAATPSGYLHRFSLTLGLEIMKAEKDRVLFPVEFMR